tara:strand:- start:1196 stop:2401 length:1206 start_codon:yes stop_codon:yes gene_type:complete
MNYLTVNKLNNLKSFYNKYKDSGLLRGYTLKGFIRLFQIDDINISMSKSGYNKYVKSIKDRVLNRDNFTKHILLNQDSLSKSLILNVGIEIETCTKQDKNKIKYKYFMKEFDDTIKCTMKEYKLNSYESFNKQDYNNMSVHKKNIYTPIEYIIKGYLNHTDLPKLNSEIRSIQKNSIRCTKNTCGLHYHISSNSILFDKYGLLFLINLLLEWQRTYQIKFLNTFPYQTTAYDLYTKQQHRNIPICKKKSRESSCIERNIDIKNTCYKKIIPYTTQPYSRMNYLTNKDISCLIKYKKKLLKNIKKNKVICIYEDEVILNHIDKLTRHHGWKPYLTIIVIENNDEFTKFIHVEFRGLRPLKPGDYPGLDIISLNSTFIKAVHDMYQTVLLKTIKEMRTFGIQI